MPHYWLLWWGVEGSDFRGTLKVLAKHDLGEHALDADAFRHATRTREIISAAPRMRTAPFYPPPACATKMEIRRVLQAENANTGTTICMFDLLPYMKG